MAINNCKGIVLLFPAALVILLCIRYFLKKDKKQKISIGNHQFLGERKDQEDSFSTITNENSLMAVLADGMGGFSKGKMASGIVIDSFTDEFSRAQSIDQIDNFLIKLTKQTNKKIIDSSKGVKTGTTLVAVIINEHYLHWVSVGDSAIILFRNKEFINLNKKHTFGDILEQQCVSGKISKEQIFNNPIKKRLTSYLGYENLNDNDIEINKEPLKLIKGDKIILCSDGVYNSISELEMEKILTKKMKPYETCDEIINAIKNKRVAKQDNATIIILKKDY